MEFPTLTTGDTAGHHQYAIYDEATGRDVAMVYSRDADSRALADLLARAPEMLALLRETDERFAALRDVDEARPQDIAVHRKIRTLLHEVDHGR
jgi:hypothetical protein